MLARSVRKYTLSSTRLWLDEPLVQPATNSPTIAAIRRPFSSISGRRASSTRSAMRSAQRSGTAISGETELPDSASEPLVTRCKPCVLCMGFLAQPLKKVHFRGDTSSFRRNSDRNWVSRAGGFASDDLMRMACFRRSRRGICCGIYLFEGSGKNPQKRPWRRNAFQDYANATKRRMKSRIHCLQA